MREVVKTLKQFAEDKKQIERQKDQLIKELENPNFKINMFQKVKDQNNEMVAENKKKEILILKIIDKVIKFSERMPEIQKEFKNVKTAEDLLTKLTKVTETYVP